VRLVPPDGAQAVEVGRTDASGRLSFALPKGSNGTWEVQVDGGPGHRDYLELPVQKGQAQLDRLSQQPSPAGGPFGLSPLHGLLILGGLSSLGGVLIAHRQGRRPPHA
jgi:nickel transport protein